MIVSLLHPNHWLRDGHWPYAKQTPGNSGQWKGVTFRINDRAVREADFLVVHDDLDAPVTVRIPVGNAILVTGEEKSTKQYPREFVDQFDVVVTSRDDIQHPRVIRTHYFHPWSVKKTYDELLAERPAKARELSAIISNTTLLKGHKSRFAFINQAKGHFKDRLDWFCKGDKTSILDKWNGLAPYYYSIAIENSQHNNYFTEKITDCFLAQTLPFYFGCPNIGEYFDDRSMVKIDLTDFTGVIDLMEGSLGSNLFHERAQHLLDARKLVLDKYHFIAALTDLLRQQVSAKSIAKKHIRPYCDFTKLTVVGRLKRAARVIVTGS